MESTDWYEMIFASSPERRKRARYWFKRARKNNNKGNTHTLEFKESDELEWKKRRPTQRARNRERERKVEQQCRTGHVRASFRQTLDGKWFIISRPPHREIESCFSRKRFVRSWCALARSVCALLFAETEPLRCTKTRRMRAGLAEASQASSVHHPPKPAANSTQEKMMPADLIRFKWEKNQHTSQAPHKRETEK